MLADALSRLIERCDRDSVISRCAVDYEMERLSFVVALGCQELAQRCDGRLALARL